jgi:hypothetical protein
MSSNPLHFLITTLTQFHDAVWKCQTATTGEERDQAQSAWNEVRKSFWPKYHRPAEAIRELADPALAWCSQKGFRGEADTATIETAASYITELAMLTCPCAYPEIYANKDDLWERWNREGEFLLAADGARRGLRRLAALTGEAWQPNGQGHEDDIDRDQGGTGQGEGTGGAAPPQGTSVPRIEGGVTRGLQQAKNPPRDVPLDQSTMAAGQAMLAHIDSLATSNTVVRQMVIDLGARHGGAAAPGNNQSETQLIVNSAGRTPKRSTERGEGRAKLIAALTKHHQYADGGCLNLEPIGNNELAKAAGVSASTASTFFNDNFEGHTKYKVLCRDSSRLVAALKLLNNEFAPHDLYGRRPAGEDDRDGGDD